MNTYHRSANRNNPARDAARAALAQRLTRMCVDTQLLRLNAQLARSDGDESAATTYEALAAIGQSSIDWYVELDDMLALADQGERITHEMLRWTVADATRAQAVEAPPIGER